MKAIALLGSLVIMSVLSACSKVPDFLNNNSISYVDQSSVIAKQAVDVSSAAHSAVAAVNSSSASGKVQSIENVMALAGHSSLSIYRPDTAFSIGYPKECGGSWHSWNFQGKYRAASESLYGCLKYREGFDEHTSSSCSCREEAY